MTMKGETLIEVLIALSVAVVVITAVSFLSVSSLNNSQFVRDQNLAGKYTQEGIEVVTSLRNASYSQFAAYDGKYCLAKNATTLSVSVCSPNIDGKFVRSVTISQGGACGANFANVLVSVTWNSSKCAPGVYCHSSKLSTCLSTKSPISSP